MLAKSNQEASQRSARAQLEEILKRATHKKASDIHLKAGLPPIVRINGQLFYLKDKETSSVHKLRQYEIQEIAYSIMSDRHRARYEDGFEVDLGFEIPDTGRYRINICKQRGEPRIVCRFIPQTIQTLEDLGMPPVIEKLSLAGRGLVLVTGPTGSGKSTLLAAMIDHITKKRSCHIITIEDPIEFLYQDRKSIVTQREVGQDTHDFKQSLKYALRQDPDVILVGEMRDEETTLLALSAAETGHLVLSTLHTTDARETIGRILGNVPKNRQDQVRSQLATQLKGIVSLRLPKTKTNKGRIPALEILVHNQRVQDCIADASRTVSLKKVMESSNSMGMQSMDQSLMKLITDGLITEEEALFHCDNVRDFKLKLSGIDGLGSNRDQDDSVEKIQDGLQKKLAHLGQKSIEFDLDDESIANYQDNKDAEEEEIDESGLFSKYDDDIFED